MHIYKCTHAYLVRMKCAALKLVTMHVGVCPPLVWTVVLLSLNRIMYAKEDVLLRNLRDLLFGYYSGNCAIRNRVAARSSTMHFLIFNRMFEWQLVTQNVHLLNDASPEQDKRKTHSAVMSFNRELFVCGHLEALKLSVATEITMMELHYVSDSCKPISYLEDNFQTKSHIHLSLFWLCASVHRVRALADTHILLGTIRKH